MKKGDLVYRVKWYGSSVFTGLPRGSVLSNGTSYILTVDYPAKTMIVLEMNDPLSITVVDSDFKITTSDPLNWLSMEDIESCVEKFSVMNDLSWGDVRRHVFDH